VNTSIGTVQEINQIGVIAGTAAAIIGETVRKVGRTTGLTTGTVTDINSPANSTAGSSFTHQVRITPVAGVDKFSNNGDSGSVIVNATNQVVALLWGGNTGPSVANNIGDVLTAMGITIPAGVADIDFVRDTASPVPLPTEREMLLRRVQRTLRQTERGQVVLNVVLEFRFEVMQLLQKQRAVGVTWQRHQGPTFLAALFRSLKEPAYQIPRQIEGVSVQRLLMSMAATLEEHGSARLRAAISRHALAILEAADQHNTVHAILQHLTGDSHPIVAQAQGICPPAAVHS
jgi:hypothetical protein